MLDKYFVFTLSQTLQGWRLLLSFIRDWKEVFSTHIFSIILKWNFKGSHFLNLICLKKLLKYWFIDVFNLWCTAKGLSYKYLCYFIGRAPGMGARMPRGSPGDSFAAPQLGSLFRLYSWYMWAVCLSFCLWGWEASPLCCPKTVKLFSTHLLSSWEFLSLLVLKCFQIAH